VTKKLSKLHLSVPVAPMGGIDAHLVEFLFSPETNNIKGWDITRSICRDRPVVSTRNRLVKRFLDDTDADVLLSIDSDQIPFTHADDRLGGLDKLLEAINRDDVDVVNAITLRITDKGPCPVIYKIPDMENDQSNGELYAEILSRPRGLHELKNGVVGGAGIMVPRYVLERFREEGVPWFWDVFDEDPKSDTFGERKIGHDVWFFLKCHEFGFRPWVDTRLFWGHVKPSDLRAEFRREMDHLGAAYSARKSPEILASVLRQQWGNERFTAPPGFIARMVEEVQKVPQDQIVLECGSGLTSVVLNQMLPKERLVILEHDRGWFTEVHHQVNGSLRYAPLEDKGGYEWYTLPELGGKKIGLVVCDGPPIMLDQTQARYGTVPGLWEHLADRFVILLDDTHHPGIIKTLVRWKDEYELGSKHYSTEDHAYGVIEHVKKPERVRV
jgi:hypothetical protein